MLHAEIFISFFAKFTFTARPIEPGHSYAIADFQIADAGAGFGDAARYFMPQDQRLFHDSCELLPVAFGHVQIGMADAAGFYLYEDFIGGDLRARDFFDLAAAF